MCSHTGVCGRACSSVQHATRHTPDALVGPPPFALVVLSSWFGTRRGIATCPSPLVTQGWRCGGRGLAVQVCFQCVRAVPERFAFLRGGASSVACTCEDGCPLWPACSRVCVRETSVNSSAVYVRAPAVSCRSSVALCGSGVVQWAICFGRLVVASRAVGVVGVATFGWRTCQLPRSRPPQWLSSPTHMRGFRSSLQPIPTRSLQPMCVVPTVEQSAQAHDAIHCSPAHEQPHTHTHTHNHPHTKSEIW